MLFSNGLVTLLPLPAGAGSETGQYTLRLGVLDRTANLIGTLTTAFNVP